MKQFFMFCVLISTYGYTQTASGYWKGHIALPNMELEILVSLSDDNGWEGTIDIPLQGLRDYALSAVEVNGKQVSFEMGGIPGQPTFEGVLNSEGDKIEGKFQQNGQTMTFLLARSEAEKEKVSFELTPKAGTSITGTWRAVLKAGPTQLRLELEVGAESGDNAKGSMTSLDQNATFQTEIKWEGSTINFSMPQIQAAFEGQRNGDFSEIEGIWKQGGMDFPISFIRVN